MARTASTKRNTTTAPKVKATPKRTTKRTPEAVRLFLEGLDQRRHAARTSFQTSRDDQVRDMLAPQGPLSAKHTPYRSPTEVNTHEALYLLQLCELSEELLHYQCATGVNVFYSAFSTLSQALTEDKAVVERLIAVKLSTRRQF